ncbi:ribonuclease catalytic domain-containing protein [Pseudodesulfovibrio sp.]|uniref:ribonuclease catalytic domain-containing protein n=1 Tax=unclassified Pseudodesulfovibrio TaxID=2661612 RepID=UPI003AFFE800
MAKSNLISSPVRPGTVVEFMQGDQPQLAWVMEETSGRLRLWTINKREMKLPVARLLPWTGPMGDPEANRQEIQDILNEHQERRGEIQAGLDVMELWALAQGELENAPLSWFADLLWEDAGPDELAGLGRAMLATKTHFKFRPPVFEIWPEEKVELRLREQTEEKSREAVTSAGQTLLAELWSAYIQGRAPRLPALDNDLADALARILKGKVAENLDENDRKIWTAISKGTPDIPHVALLLAQSWGILPPHHNYYLDEAGYAWGDEWPKPFANEIEQIKEDFSNQAQEPEPLDFLSIDGATTRDIDDMFHIEATPNGYRLTIGLARPDVHWTFGSDLDKAVMDRATSIYLPEGTAHMLPEEFGTGLYSLCAGEVRPALLTVFELDDQGELLSVTPRQSWVNVRENMTYEAAEEAIISGSDQSLILAHRVAGLRLERRLKNGACVIRKPEPEVKLLGEGSETKVEITLKDSCPRAELVISEFMILANSGLALWAKDNDVPLLHRTQDIALPQESAGIFTEPAEILRSVKLLLPPTLETTPRKHAALAVPAYAPITSPLRRYTDFINMAQVCSFLSTGTPRLDAEELDRLAMHLDIRIKAVGAVQRFRPRYWKLAYLAQNRKALQQAVLVEENGPMVTLSMPHIQVNVRVPRKMLGDKLYLGQQFQINFTRVDPLSNELKVGDILED